MTDVTLLLKGDAAQDVSESLTAATPAALALKASLASANALSNNVAIATRPNTGGFNVDSFIFPGNPGSVTWPDWKETALPFTSTNDTDFGTWNAAKTVFSFSKDGLYNFSGGIPTAVVGGSNTAFGTREVLALLLEITGQSPLRYIVGTGQFLANAYEIYGQFSSFSLTLPITALQTAGIKGMRTRYASSNSDDLLGTGLGIPGTNASTIFNISRVR